MYVFFFLIKMVSEKLFDATYNKQKNQSKYYDITTNPWILYSSEF